MGALFVATAINSGHIDKLGNLSCYIICIGDRETVLKMMLTDIDDKNTYMANDYQESIPVREGDLTFSESSDNGQEYFYDSEELGYTWTLSQYSGNGIVIV